MIAPLLRWTPSPALPQPPPDPSSGRDVAPDLRLPDRTVAGQRLAPHLRAFAGRPDLLVLALPRGGVPVALEIARALHAPLDVLVVRKLGVPGQEELAMGAIASGGVEFLDTAIIRSLQVPAAAIETVLRRERAELRRRERAYRGTLPAPSYAGRTLLLVDDGLATGSSMRAAVRAVNLQRPQAVFVVAPVASTEAVETLRQEASGVVTLLTTPRLFAIGEYYRDFSPVSDAEVQAALTRLSRQSPQAASAPSP